MQPSLPAGSRFDRAKEVPPMLSYPRFHAAEQVPAAFGAVLAGMAVVSVPGNRNIGGTRMTKFVGQVRPPRKIPL
jgi:hypothetical protein